MGAVLSSKNNLNYPGGRAQPRIDYRHPAFGNVNGGPTVLVFSGVATSGGSFLFLNRTGGSGGYSGVAGKMHPVLGPGIYSTSTSGYLVFGSGGLYQPGPAANQGMTIAGIFAWDGGLTDVPISLANTGTYGAYFFTPSGQLVLSYRNSSSLGVVIPPGTQINDALFVAVSATTLGSGSSVTQRYNGIIRNLTRGTTIPSSGTFTDTAPSFSGPTYVFISNLNSGQNDGYTNPIGTAAILYNYLSPQILAGWAAAPWDFWYPPTLSQTLISLKAPPAQPQQARAWIMA